LESSRSVDHVIEITKLIKFDGLDGAHPVVSAEAVSSHFNTIALSTSVVNTTHHSIRGLVFDMKVKILYFNLLTIDLRPLSPHEHHSKLSIQQIADKRDLNVVWLAMNVEELSLGVL
jgi:hypothetical protein